MAHQVPRYFQQITDSTFAEDYELNDAIIRELEKMLQDYATTKGWDSEARADAGRHAKREIEALAKTLNKLPEQWQVAFSSHYLQQHIINAYCGRYEVTSPPDEADQRKIAELAACVEKLSTLTAEFQRLNAVVNSVKAMGHWDSYAFSQFSSGRPSDAATNKLIAGLDALASKMPTPPQSKNDFIEGALNIIGLQFAPRRTPSTRTRKTLKNKRSMSRK